MRVPVKVTTEDFGTLEGTMTFKASEDEQGEGRVAWTPAQRLPGLEEGEEVRRRSGRQPQRANIYDAGGRLLNSDPTGASIAGTAGDKPTGLERIYDDRLAGRPSSSLRFGDRVIARVDRPPRASRSTRRSGSGCSAASRTRSATISAGSR